MDCLIYRVEYNYGKWSNVFSLQEPVIDIISPCGKPGKLHALGHP
jgi:hypothetical protein